MNEIQLVDIEYPYNAVGIAPSVVQADHGDPVPTLYAVTHEAGVSSPTSPAGVSVVSAASGRILRRLVTDGTTMKSPRQLAAVAVGNDLEDSPAAALTSFVVADRGNDRLCVFVNSADVESRYQTFQIEAPDGGFRGPSTVCFDETGRRLFVGEWTGGRILVFDCSDDVLSGSKKVQGSRTQTSPATARNGTSTSTSFVSTSCKRLRF